MIIQKKIVAIETAPLDLLAWGGSLFDGLNQLNVFIQKALPSSEKDLSKFESLESVFKEFKRQVCSLMKISMSLEMHLDKGIIPQRQPRSQSELFFLLRYSQLNKTGKSWKDRLKFEVNSRQVSILLLNVIPQFLHIVCSSNDHKVKEFGNKFIIDVCRYIWERESETPGLLPLNYKEACPAILYKSLSRYFEVLNLQQMRCEDKASISSKFLDSGLVYFEIENFFELTPCTPGDLYSFLSMMSYQILLQPKTQKMMALSIRLQLEMEWVLKTYPEDKPLRFSRLIDLVNNFRVNNAYSEAVDSGEECLSYLNSLDSQSQGQLNYLKITVLCALIRDRLKLMRDNSLYCTVKVSGDWKDLLSAYESDIKSNPYRFEEMTSLLSTTFLEIVTALNNKKESARASYIKLRLHEMGASFKESIPIGASSITGNSIDDMIAHLTPKKQKKIVLSEASRQSIEKDLLAEEANEKALLMDEIKTASKTKRKGGGSATCSSQVKEVYTEREGGNSLDSEEVVVEKSPFLRLLGTLSKSTLEQKTEEIYLFEKDLLLRCRKLGTLNIQEQTDLAYAKSEMANCSLMSVLDRKDGDNIKECESDFLTACELANDALEWSRKGSLPDETKENIKSCICITLGYVKEALIKIKENHTSRVKTELRYCETQLENIEAEWESKKKSLKPGKEGDPKRPSKRSQIRQQLVHALTFKIQRLKNSTYLDGGRSFFTKACRNVADLERVFSH